MKLNLAGIGSVRDLVHDVRWNSPDLAHEAHRRADAVPGRVFLVPDIPKTDRGKLNRDTVARFCLNESAAP